jgi:hypothetical protein
MPKAVPGIPGLTDYGDEGDNAPPKQTVFPKSQGGQATSGEPGKETGIPGLKDYSSGVSASEAKPFWSWDTLKESFHPQPADLNRPQTWRDWVTKTYSPSASQVGRAALDDVSFGTADYARSKLTGENIADLRAQTEDAQTAMGPMGPVVNAATYIIPGTGVAKGLKAVGAAGKVAGALGRYGVAALEGGTANAASSVGHQAGGYIDPLKVAKDTATGTVFGVGGQAAGDAAAAAMRNVSNYVRGSPGRGGEKWDMRTRAAEGDPTLPGDVGLYQKTLASDDPAQPALARTQAALNQSVEPGRMADAVYAGTGALGAAFGAPPDYALLGGIGGLTAGGVTRYTLGAPGAKAINTIDRNINVGQALDQLYPALYGPQKNPALDTSGWADAVRQFAIGGERPNNGGAQWW